MRSIGGREEWEALCRKMPAPHLLQGWDWGEIKSRWGWQVQRFAWMGPPSDPLPQDSGLASGPTLVDRAEDKGTRALAQLLWRQVGPFRLGYLPKGPLLADLEDLEAWTAALVDLEVLARGQGICQLKMDADVPAGADNLVAAWRALGWRPSEEQIQFPNTMTSSLQGDEAAILARMKAKTRYNLRLAERRGVTLRHGGLDALEDFLPLYVETGQRGGFGLRSADYYRDVVGNYLKRGAATVILAEKDGRALAGVVPVVHGRTALYLYGASSEAGREDMPAYLAQWESLRWARAQGCARYDWWGGPRRLEAEDPLWGLYRFKSGFGAELQAQQGAWDLPVLALQYAAYSKLSTWRAAWLARRR